MVSRVFATQFSLLAIPVGNVPALLLLLLEGFPLILLDVSKGEWDSDGIEAGELLLSCTCRDEGNGKAIAAADVA